MPVPELAAEYLKILVWPIVVLAAVILFRGRLDELVGRLTRARFPGGELWFKQQVEEARESAGITAPAAEGEGDVESEQIRANVRENPAAGLAVLRMELERELRKIYDRQGVPAVRGGVVVMARNLLDLNLVSQDAASSIISITPLMNFAVHGLPVEQEEAVVIGAVGLRALRLLRDSSSD